MGVMGNTRARRTHLGGEGLIRGVTRDQAWFEGPHGTGVLGPLSTCLVSVVDGNVILAIDTCYTSPSKGFICQNVKGGLGGNCLMDFVFDVPLISLHECRRQTIRTAERSWRQERSTPTLSSSAATCMAGWRCGHHGGSECSNCRRHLCMRAAWAAD